MKKKTGKKILFVCTGNTCRSPMAERLLQAYIKEKKWRGFVVCSAGLAAAKGDTINQKSAAVLTEYGLEVGEFRSTLLKEEMLLDAFAVICMTEGQKDVLLDMRWQALRRANKIGEEEIPNTIYSFAELGGYSIPDPYGRDMECYRYVFTLMASSMTKLAENLQLEAFAEKPKPRATKPQKKEVNATLPPSNGENAPKKRGRPKKVATGENTSSAIPTMPKKRGRPKKAQSAEMQTSVEQLRIIE